jgi:hypothetical protein
LRWCAPQKQYQHCRPGRGAKHPTEGSHL